MHKIYSYFPVRKSSLCIQEYMTLAAERLYIYICRIQYIVYKEPEPALVLVCSYSIYPFSDSADGMMLGNVALALALARQPERHTIHPHGY